MKDVPLTKEHKSKLIEMCKAFFTEYNEISFGNPPFGVSDDIIFYKGSESYPDYPYFDSSINWFQFLLIYLLPKLDVRETMFVTLSIHQVKPYSGCDFSHPIDYLYGKFKQQENEKI